MDLNPSAARSLEKGLEETLTLHRLEVPPTLRKTLSSTNAIESTFSMVGRLRDRVKNWQGGDYRERWMASGLLWAETRWNRVHGYRQIPALLQQLSLKPSTSAVAERKMAAQTNRRVAPVSTETRTWSTDRPNLGLWRLGLRGTEEHSLLSGGFRCCSGNAMVVSPLPGLFLWVKATDT